MEKYSFMALNIKIGKGHILEHAFIAEINFRFELRVSDTVKSMNI